MVKDQKLTLTRPSILWLSWFGSGLSPIAPGTIGSIAAIPLLYLLDSLHLSFWFIVGLLFFATLGTCLLTEHIQKEFGLHDPQWIVIDEVLGMLLTWLFVLKVDFLSLTIVFVSFRFFDIIKFWPASYFDKKVTHGAGTILDDIISGIYSGCLTYLIDRFLLPLAS